MKLSQSEIIQVLRKRAGMTQGTFGARAFNTSYESGRTKVKNIELGKQQPTIADIKQMARVLQVDPELLIPGTFSTTNTEHRNVESGGVFSKKTLERYPDLDKYIDILDKAITLNDEELIAYISGKISALFASTPVEDAMNM